LPDFGQYITDYGWREGKPGNFDGAGDLDILNNPYIRDAPRMNLWLNQRGRLGSSMAP
jgi:hypothetical protein